MPREFFSSLKLSKLYENVNMSINKYLNTVEMYNLSTVKMYIT